MQGIFLYTLAIQIYQNKNNDTNKKSKKVSIPKKIQVMLRYLKFIVTALLVVMAVGYANANGPVPGLNKLEPIHTDQYNKAQLAVPKLHISLESTPKLTDIPFQKI